MDRVLDTPGLLIARDQALNQDFQIRIRRMRRQIQQLTRAILGQQEHIAQLSEEFYHETTTTTRRSAILREITRTRQGIAPLQDMINLHEEDIRMEEENEKRRHEQIKNVVKFYLYQYHPGVE